ncbi:hypothetical protein [Qipengyuania atrilutea]|uniref:Argininosuccinate lyase n=1 Tax=Qipengyuania atrilutea TaxID=2744473 RepID=A0A850H310_9SPHN|nr:hypothetical protein [Actirhodobacter atriluteus]NVD44957.1 hypothetical protein [Actirhodobacter atriluteus]
MTRMRQTMMRAGVPALLLALAGCGDDAPPAPEEGEAAAPREVVPGTINDDMMPLDTLGANDAPPASEESPEAEGAPAATDVTPAAEPEE